VKDPLKADVECSDFGLEQVINVEWGNFFCESLPRTFADEGLDKDSSNPGRQVSSKSSESFHKADKFTTIRKVNFAILV